MGTSKDRRLRARNQDLLAIYLNICTVYKAEVLGRPHQDHRTRRPQESACHRTLQWAQRSPCCCSPHCRYHSRYTSYSCRHPKPRTRVRPGGYSAQEKGRKIGRGKKSVKNKYKQTQSMSELAGCGDYGLPQRNLRLLTRTEKNTFVR
jgi:hypothetical protein